jgi:transposase InsO family protein
MTIKDDTAHLWARFRLAVIGNLISSPPARGDLQNELEKLSQKLWRHPITKEMVTFGQSTLEKWYYEARDSENPIDVLRRKLRSVAGLNRVMSPQLLAKLEAYYREHPGWTYQLHADNIKALVEEEPALGPAPSYSTVRRRMKKNGWFKRPSRTKKTEGMRRAEERLEKLEVRSYEVGYVHELWHFDYHEGRRKVVLPDGTWHKPYLLSILDDCSRLNCHAQWYLSESTETLTHGHHQAFLKRGLPRSELSDNGSPMRAEETANGLEGLSIRHERTLEYSPYQNAKQEVFWSTQIEGRLMPMIERVEPLTLDFLNEATCAFVEQEYNRKHHEELGCSPLQRALDVKSVARECPELEQLRFQFTVKQKRTQRRSDGTVSIKGTRFEIPNKLRNMDALWVRYRRWDLSMAYVVDPKDHRLILARIMPLDKLRNSNRKRRTLTPPAPEPSFLPSEEPVPPVLRKLLRDYAECGLPPAYIPLESVRTTTTKEDCNE